MMRTRSALRFSGFAVLLALAACASPDPTFYTLETVPGTSAAGTILAAARTIEVRKPGLAGYLDRSDLVLKNADYHLSLNTQERWAEPLGDMVGRVLTQDLAQRLPRSSVFGEGGAITADPDLRVEVDIQRFDTDASGTVTLSAQVAIEAGREHVPVASRHVLLTASPGGPGAGALAAAMSALLGQLADAIVGSAGT